MVSQLNICFPELLWCGRHGLRVVPFHSWIDHVTVHNAVYFWLYAETLVRIGSVLPGVSCFEKHLSGIFITSSFNHWNIRIFIIKLSINQVKSSPCSNIFFVLFCFFCFVKVSCCEICATWRKLLNKANMLIKIWSRLVPFTLRPYLKPWQQFQNILTGHLSTMPRQKEGFGAEYLNIKNTIIIVQSKLPSSIFSHFWGLSQWGEMFLPGAICQEMFEGGWGRHVSKSAV